MTEAAALPRESDIRDHDPGLYTGTRVAEIADDICDVGAEACRFFETYGYLAVARAFPEEMTVAARTAIDDLIEGRRSDFRGLQFEAGLGDKKKLSREQRRLGVRKLMSYVAYDRRLLALAEYLPILDVVRRLVGGEPERFQEMALLKPPHIGREKPWHQDCAYFNLPLGTPVVGVWIALDEATIANGALHVIPGSHREGPINHFKGRDWQICDSDVAVERDVAVPLKPGGVLFWHGMTHHGSPRNRSGLRRRALQLHFRPRGVAETTTEDRMTVFGGDVRGATC